MKNKLKTLLTLLLLAVMALSVVACDTTDIKEKTLKVIQAAILRMSFRMEIMKQPMGMIQAKKATRIVILMLKKLFLQLKKKFFSNIMDL